MPRRDDIHTILIIGIVAGLELIRTTRYPSARSALQACAPE